jgi:hypothetical protein
LIAEISARALGERRPTIYLELQRQSRESNGEGDAGLQAECIRESDVAPEEPRVNADHRPDGIVRHLHAFLGLELGRGEAE